MNEISAHLAKPAERHSTEAQLQKLKSYLEAGVPENTRRAMKAAIADYCHEWGGMLPATPRDICLYIVDRASKHAHTTISQRLACLAKWHQGQGFADPTKDGAVKQAMKGVRNVHPHQAKQARPMTIEELQLICKEIDGDHARGVSAGKFDICLRASRDKALLLVAFWRAFRSDELSSMQAQFVTCDKNVGMNIFLGRSKTDKQSEGLTYYVPALKDLCPALAYSNWIEESGISQGAVFRKISKHGKLSVQGMNPRSLNELLRSIFKRAGVESTGISTHSPRRGFAHWAVANEWSTKGLMDYVGWKDIRNATKYMPAEHSFGSLALASSNSNLMPGITPGNCLPGAGTLIDSDEP